MRHYEYDDNGNRTRALELDREVNYAPADGQDRIASATVSAPLSMPQTVSWSYSANGEVLSKAIGAMTKYFSYDTIGNLRDVTLANGRQIKYLVDASGRRIGKKVNGVLTQGWLYQDTLKPIAELDGNGNIVSTFVYAGKVNVPEYMVKGGIQYRLLTDHLGSVRLVVNASNGTIAQRFDYDDYAYPPLTDFTIHRGKKGMDKRTVRDGGAGWVYPRPRTPNGVGQDEWLDLLYPTQRDGIEVDLVETEVADSCPCPSGWSGSANPPVPPK